MNHIRHRCCSLPFLLLLTLTLVGCRGLDFQGIPPSSPEQVRSFRSSVNHIIFMLQENRSFDHYFGRLGEYREKNGYGKASDIDGLPSDAMNESTDGSPIHSFHLDTTCIEALSPDWLESHLLVNRDDPGSHDKMMNGFVDTAAQFAQANDLVDKAGARAMGYYDERELPYYYFMASNFGTSDRWFSPLMSESIPNRIFLHAATTGGHVHEPSGHNCCDNLKTIFHRLEENGISWKIYYSDTQANGVPLTDINNYWPDFASQHAANIVPIAKYFDDLTNGTLPQVAFIQAGLLSGRDEHPGGQIARGDGGNDIMLGARYVAEIVNALMSSYAWKDSVFVLTFDEGGALYDHVPPQPAARPDDHNPSDLLPKDSRIEPQGKFDTTGFRLPLIVISPFSNKSYVSHTVADFTAILRMIETRFDLEPLTHRDAAQSDMLEYFDFNSIPWETPPSPPVQPFVGNCHPGSIPQFGVEVKTP